ncbi:MAG: tyrosine-type recombinase/integrase [Planctomycetes bacterium]|nr:tyrosine-type recombinase/integrase [Planctomycetota bacterium]
MIFPSRLGTPMDSRNLFKAYKGFLSEAGLPDIRFHDLRHTAESLMLNHGIPVIVVSRRLGHAKPSITLDVYGHLFPSIQVEAAQKIDDLITPIELNTQNQLHPICTR